jgi:hypothetical protein
VCSPHDVFHFHTEFLYSCHASWNPTLEVPRCHLQRMRTIVGVRKRKRKRRKIMKAHCVVHAVTTMDRMSSGYAVMLVRHGSMVNASRSLLPRPSTLSTISVRTAAREPEHDPGEIHCLCQEEEFGSCCKHPHGDRMNDVCAFSSVRRAVGS